MPSKLSLSLSRARSAFTLVELMIVIAIIGILAVALFPSLTGYLARSRDTRRIQDINKTASSLMLYEIDHGNMKRTNTYTGGYDAGAWDFSSQPKINPQFLSYLESSGYGNTPLDPINNADSYMASGGFPGEFAYFYYCFTGGEISWMNYDQYVLGARMEQPANNGSSLQNGRIGGDGTIYYFTKWNEGKTNATTCN